MRKLMVLPLILGIMLTACSESEKEEVYGVAPIVNPTPAPAPQIPDATKLEQKEIREVLTPYLSDEKCQVEFKASFYDAKNKFSEDIFRRSNVTVVLLENGSYTVEVDTKVQHYPSNTAHYDTKSYAYREGQWEDDISALTLKAMNQTFAYVRLQKYLHEIPGLKVTIYDNELRALGLPYAMELKATYENCEVRE